MPLVHALLGSDAVLTHFGCMLSFPGSAKQPWHSDGPHVRGCGEAAHRLPFPTGGEKLPADKGGAKNDGEMDGSAAAASGDREGEEGRSSGGQAQFIAPCHALNVFVPLVDLTADSARRGTNPPTACDPSPAVRYGWRRALDLTQSWTRLDSDLTWT